jgi:hypothetical protein
MQTKIKIIELQKRNGVLERKMYSSDTVGKGIFNFSIWQHWYLRG